MMLLKLQLVIFQRLDTHFIVITNQNSIKVPKVVKPTNNKTLGTSVINRPIPTFSCCETLSPSIGETAVHNTMVASCQATISLIAQILSNTICA